MKRIRSRVTLQSDSVPIGDADQFDRWLIGKHTSQIINVLPVNPELRDVPMHPNYSERVSECTFYTATVEEMRELTGLIKSLDIRTSDQSIMNRIMTILTQTY